jgi:hypothetical protein
MPEVKVKGNHITRLRLTTIGWNSTDIVWGFAYILVNFIVEGSPV